MNQREYVIKNLLVKGYFKPQNSMYCLHEDKDLGKSALDVNIGGTNYCIEDYDHARKCNVLFEQDAKLGMQKSVDHVILEQKSEEDWKLHMIEMKTTVGNNTWSSIKQKVRSSYLSMSALAAVLGLNISDVCVYTTYEIEKFGGDWEKANLSVAKPLLGEPAINSKVEEWDKNRMIIDIGDKLEFRHVPVKMKRDLANNTLQGCIEII